MIESVCGVFQPALIPDWFSKIGPALAVLIGLLLYHLTRRNTIKDLRARRKVLHAILRQHVSAGARFAKDARKELEQMLEGKGTSTIFGVALIFLKPTGMERMSELQAELLAFGEEGDVDIAVFIESYRAYADAHDWWVALADRDPKVWDDTNLKDSAGLLALSVPLHDVASKADAAVAATK